MLMDHAGESANPPPAPPKLCIDSSQNPILKDEAATGRATIVVTTESSQLVSFNLQQ